MRRSHLVVLGVFGVLALLSVAHAERTGRTRTDASIDAYIDRNIDRPPVDGCAVVSAELQSCNERREFLKSATEQRYQRHAERLTKLLKQVHQQKPGEPPLQPSTNQNLPTRVDELLSALEQAVQARQL
ncbi:MAG TPA: hypothetical protein VFG30_41935 [Polyangiales bacterium]|jgi:hypothetical protein|nr:hypothetical protein [Polyangiales bacterium]